MKYPEGVKRQRTRALEAGTEALPIVMAFWLKALRDQHLDWDQRNRAAENIANRCGMPVKAILDAESTGSMTIERLAEIFRDGEAKAEIERRGRIEATDVPFTELEMEKIPTRSPGDTIQ